MTARVFGCEVCIPSEPVKASSLGLDVVAELHAESHFGVSIRRCAACGQQFVWVFTETVDYAGGEDPQCRTVMPLTADEAARAIERGTPDFAELHRLSSGRRFLRDDWPASGARTCSYTTGILVGPHD